MALPTRRTLAEILRDAKGQWASLKRLVDGAAVELQATTSPRRRVVEIAEELRGYRISLGALGSTPGLAEYARSQWADAGVDIVADFTAMIAALDAVIGWTYTNFPKDQSGTYILVSTMDTSGHTGSGDFTKAQVSPLVTRLQTLSATIE